MMKFTSGATVVDLVKSLPYHAGSFGGNVTSPRELWFALGGVIITVAALYVIFRRWGGK